MYDHSDNAYIRIDVYTQRNAVTDYGRLSTDRPPLVSVENCLLIQFIGSVKDQAIINIIE